MFGNSSFTVPIENLSESQPPNIPSRRVSPAKDSPPKSAYHELFQKEAQTRARSAARGPRATMVLKQPKDRVATRPASPKVTARRSEIIMQAPRPRSVTRPKTAVAKCTADKVTKCMADKGIQNTSTVESQIILSVKDVLGQFMVIKGPIDKSNLDKAMKYTKSRLRGEQVSCIDSSKEIDVVSKCSNVEANSNIMRTKNTMISAGNQRQNVQEIPKGECKRFDGKLESSLVKDEFSSSLQSQTKPFNGCDDLSLEIENRNPKQINNKHITKDSLIQHIVKNSSEKRSKEQLGTERYSKVEEVGDSHAKESKAFNLLNETNLRKYVEMLVRNIHEEIKTKDQHLSVEGSTEGNDRDKNVCICNVCRADRLNSQRYPPQHSPNHVMIVDGPKLRYTVNNRTKHHSIPRQTREMDSSIPFINSLNCKMLTPYRQYQLGPRTNFVSLPKTPGNQRKVPPQIVCYSLTTPVPSDEAREDLYLQRRKKLEVAKKGGSKIYL